MSINVCNNNSMSAITSLPSGVGGGSLNLISTQTASSSSTIDFTSGIDSTYKEYIFKFTDIHPATDNVQFSFQANVSGGSGFNETITSTFYTAYNNEAGDNAGVTYAGSYDLAQSTSFQPLTYQIGNDNDHSSNGTLHLFDPSNTTFVKHFIARTSASTYHDYERDSFVAGYFNTTSAIDEIQFKMSSGNIDSGTIKLYGVS